MKNKNELIKVHIVACNAFQYEMDFIFDDLVARYKEKMLLKITFLSQKLHIDFDLLEETLSNVLNKIEEENILLLYGSKCHKDFAFLPKKQIVLPKEKNCIEIISGTELLNKCDTFFITPMQLEHWKTFFSYKEKDLCEKSIFRQNFSKYCKNACFIDTGVKCFHDKKERLEEFSQATGLPVLDKNVDIDYFKEKIIRLLSENFCFEYSNT